MLESARKATTDMARANMAQGEELVKLKSGAYTHKQEDGGL